MASSLLNTLYTLPGMRPAAKRVLSAILPLCGPRLRGRLLQWVERAIYTNTEVIDILPPAFHYWSNMHLRPRLCRYGFNNAVEFYVQQAHTLATGLGRPLRIASLGSGRADVELDVCRSLTARGVQSSLSCVELNPRMQEDARRRVASAGCTDSFSFETSDALEWTPEDPFDVIICNQFLHHVPSVDGLIARLASHLAPSGILLSHDVVGNHGHLLWPNARQVLDRIWSLVSEHWKQERTGRRVDPFVDLDCSAYSLEGIDAGSVLPSLVSRLHPVFFFGYSAFVLTFLDRRFGGSVDAEAPGERQLVDLLAEADFDLVEQGFLAPTHMFGAFSKEQVHVVEGNVAPRRACTARASEVPRDAVDSLARRVTELTRHPVKLSS